METPTDGLPVLVAGGGIGGLAEALALALARALARALVRALVRALRRGLLRALLRRGFAVKVLEQASHIGEIGAGIQLGPNAFAAFDALGVGLQARTRAVYTDSLVMHDAVDESEVGRMPTGAAFRARFGNPYAATHRADVHLSLLEGAHASGRVSLLPGAHASNASSSTTAASPPMTSTARPTAARH